VVRLQGSFAGLVGCSGAALPCARVLSARRKAVGNRVGGGDGSGPPLPLKLFRAPDRRDSCEGLGAVRGLGGAKPARTFLWQDCLAARGLPGA